MIFLQVDYRFYAHGYLESNGHDSSFFVSDSESDFTDSDISDFSSEDNSSDSSSSSSESSSSDDCALRDSPDTSTPVDKQKPSHQLTRYCA